MRSLAELRDVADPAIDLVRTWISATTRHVMVLPPGPRAPDVLTTLQVTRRSPLGALAFDTGGILFDGGWLRMYGGGCDAMIRDLASWNRLDGAHRLPGAIVIAEDVVGGFFGGRAGSATSPSSRAIARSRSSRRCGPPATRSRSARARRSPSRSSGTWASSSAGEPEA